MNTAEFRALHGAKSCKHTSHNFPLVFVWQIHATRAINVNNADRPYEVERSEVTSLLIMSNKGRGITLQIGENCMEKSDQGHFLQLFAICYQEFMSSVLVT